MPEQRHFLDLDALPAADLRGILEQAKAAKAGTDPALADNPLAGKTLAMVFEKPSTRTRVSFEMAMRQLGGDVIVLDQVQTQLGRGETAADTARVLSRYVDAIMLRTTSQDRLLEMAAHAAVPVVNGLTDRTHPCQLMADVMTYEEHRGSIEGARIAWTGDGNNVASSWIHAAARFGFELRIASPDERRPADDVLRWARDAGADVTVGSDPEVAAAAADCIVTDTWVSMGDTDVAPHNLFARYQVNGRLMALAKPDAIFMHCLPAHRGEEVTAEVIDGPQSVVWDEAENRLHAQKSILAWCLSAP